MTLISFVDLPAEIIDVVFSYLDDDTLLGIKHYFPQFQDYVYAHLYSNVIIDSSAWETSFVKFLSNTYISCKNTEELIQIIESHPRVKPKRIEFKHPKELIHFHEKLPHVLQDAKIGVSFQCYYSSLIWDVDVIQKLIELPYVYDSVDSLVYDPPDVEIDWDQIIELTRGATSVSITTFDLTDLYRLGDERILQELELEEPIDKDELIHTPECITSLKCTLTATIEQAVTPIIFPTNLKSLQFSLVDKGTWDEGIPVLDISNLDKLESVEVDYSKKFLWRFPKNIKSIKTDGFVDLENLHINNPKLVSFSDTTASDRDLNPGENGPIIFPSQVENLELDSVYFAVTKNEIELYQKDIKHELEISKPRVTLPGSLVNLNICGSYMSFFNQKSNHIALDFRCYPLPKLSSLLFDGLNDLHLFGNKLPKFLTKLSFTHVYNVDLSIVEDLRNLIDLRIENCSLVGSQVKVEFPKSLQSLMIHDIQGPTTLIFPEMPNIRSLSILRGYLTDDRDCGVSIPPVDDTLFASSEVIVRFHFPADFGWMESLQDLTFKGCIIDQLCHIPINIKNLTMSNCGLEQIPDHFKLPHGLEYLDLNDNELTAESFTSFPYKNIRELNLLCNSINVLGPKGFADFKNLEKLILMANSLYVLDEIEVHDDMFGPRIKYLDMCSCELREPTVKAITELLKSKPGFGKLLIDDNLSSRDSQEFEPTMFDLANFLGHMRNGEFLLIDANDNFMSAHEFFDDFF